MSYLGSPFRNFESYLRIVVGLDEGDIQLILKQYNSNFVTYEITLGIYTIKDISEAVYTIGGHEGTLRIEYDDISMKTNIILKYIDDQKKFALGTLRLDEKSFFHTLLGFAPYWDYKPTTSNHVGVYNSDKILNLNTTNKIHLKCDCIDGSVVNGLRQPIFYSFVLDKLPGYKVFCEPETVHSQKINLF